MQIQSFQADAITGASRRANTALSKILEKLSTGLKINRASDDASGLAISENLRSQVRGFEMANTNIDYAMAAQYIAEGTGSQASEILQRQRELALQASNGTLTADNRASINQEYQALNEELTRISESANFNGQNVANGQGLAAGSGTVQAGANGGDTLAIRGADFTAAGLGTAGTDLLNPANIANALQAIDGAMQSTSGQRTSLGANLNRMEYAQANNERSAAMTQDAESRMRDLDIAEGVMEQARETLLSESATTAQSHFNSISRNNLMSLLQ